MSVFFTSVTGKRNELHDQVNSIPVAQSIKDGIHILLDNFNFETRMRMRVQVDINGTRKGNLSVSIDPME